MLHHLFQNDDGIARLLEEVLNQILEVHRTDHVKALSHERSEEWQGHRNGYWNRGMKTRVGTLELQIPPGARRRFLYHALPAVSKERTGSGTRPVEDGR